MFSIVRKENLAANLYLFEVEAGRIAGKAEAGQFIIVRQDEKAERIPLTIADFSREKGTITLIFQVVGASTSKLSELEAGEHILDMVGPLGVPSEIENYGTVVCIGGGVGIAPIHPIARALKGAGNRVISIIGARNKELLFWREEMRAVSDELLIATDDGSEGRKGFVTDVLKEVLEKEEVTQIWAIGPMIMMKNVAEATKEKGIKTIVSLNPIMVDGTGMCGACRVGVGEETKFACVDGPEFDGHQVDWELALQRSRFFRAEEQQSMEHHQRCGGGACRCREK